MKKHLSKAATNIKKYPSHNAKDRVRAWVVFTGEADLYWLRLLKRGFRHCFVLINDGKGWISMDPMLHQMEVKILHDIPSEYNLPFWFSQAGYVVIPAPFHNAPKRPAPWAALTCVEIIKRTLGIHKFFIFTPWQLYRHLTKQQEGEISWEH